MFAFIKRLLPKSEHDFYLTLYTVLTILFIGAYTGIYFNLARQRGERYLPLIVTLRTLVLAFFLIYFYNPLRSSFDYGRALPIFATAAGFALLLTVTRFDMLNLVHFCLYGVILPTPPGCDTNKSPMHLSDLR